LIVFGFYRFASKLWWKFRIDKIQYCDIINVIGYAIEHYNYMNIVAIESSEGREGYENI